MMKVATIREPEKISKAAKDLRWVESMNEEMQKLTKNETWDLLPSAHHQTEIGCWWIFKVKHNANDTINQCKALLPTRMKVYRVNVYV